MQNDTLETQKIQISKIMGDGDTYAVGRRQSNQV
jgi:hypothetical protein